MPFFQKQKAQGSVPVSADHGENEKGSMTVFGLSMTVGIVAAGGIALDTMYYESKRVATQDALDRCSLMAALAQNRVDGGATTNRTAQQVAKDCVAKSLGSSTGLTLDIEAENSGRSATLSGGYTFASRKSGSTDSETFALSSTTTQTLPNLEVSIAIDLTNQGNWNIIKEPLITFLNTVTAPDTGRKISINIVPFGKNVVLDPALMARFNTELRPPFATIGNRSCILFPEDDKDEIEIDLDKTYRWSWPLEIEGRNYTTPRISAHFYYESMPSQYLSQNTAYYNAGIGLGQLDRLLNPTYMMTGSAHQIHGNCHVSSVSNAPLLGGQMPRPGDAAPAVSIVAKLNSLQPILRAGPTAAATVVTDANSAEGMKWALAAMDPSMRQIFTSQIGENISRANLAGRPLDYGEEDSQKILIFVANNVFNMNDGSFDQSTASVPKVPARAREIRPEYLDGSLPDPQIYRVAIPGLDNLAFRYSIYHENAPGPNKYWVTSNSYGDTQPFWAPEPFKYSEDQPAERQSWRQVFEHMTVDYLIHALYMVPMNNIGVLPGNSNFHYQTLANRFTYVETDGSKVLGYFKSLCDEAKDKGVIIYTLLGNGTSNKNQDTAWNTKATLARSTYSECATTPAHSFLTGTAAQTNTALRLISSNIAQMTLTQ